MNNHEQKYEIVPRGISAMVIKEGNGMIKIERGDD